MPKNTPSVVHRRSALAAVSPARLVQNGRTFSLATSTKETPNGSISTATLPSSGLGQSQSREDCQIVPIAPSGRCLVIESNALILIDLEQIIQSVGIGPIDHAANATQALELLKTETYQFAILDFDTSAQKVEELFTNLQHQGTQIAIIAFSRDDAQKLGQNNGIPLIMKPFTVEAVEIVLRKFIIPT
jgi:hypothetical protein